MQAGDPLVRGGKGTQTFHLRVQDDGDQRPVLDGGLGLVGSARPPGDVDVAEAVDREGRLPLLPLLVKDVAEVQRLGAPTAGAPRDPQEVLDHPGQPVDLLDAGTRLRPGLLVPCQQLHLLQAQAQRGQGRAQLVGGVRGELPLCRQAPGHALSRSHELSLDQVDLLDP